MKSGLISHPELCWIGSAKDWQEVLSHFAEIAIREGFAKSGFGDALIQREEEFPTGLPTKIPVAIPHAYPEFINKVGVGIALLDPAVSFMEMGAGEGHLLSVHLVVLMLVTDEVAHNSDLATIIDMFKEPDWFETFSKASTPIELSECFTSRFDNVAQRKLH